MVLDVIDAESEEGKKYICYLNVLFNINKFCNSS